jgi:hypothetical protein
MSYLNEHFDLYAAPKWDRERKLALRAARKAFVNEIATRRLFLAGTELFKLTNRQPFQADRKGNGAIDAAESPWWCSVTPISGTDDKGYDGLLAAARKAGVSVSEYARESLAVMFQWNPLEHRQLGWAEVHRIELTQPVYGFHGRTAPQRNDRLPLASLKLPRDQSWLKGGGFQIYIPNLTAKYFRPAMAIDYLV